MPGYPWFFEEVEKDGKKVLVPNERGLGILVYLQWLGTWEVKPTKEWALK
jgi:hypothetical protein